MEVRLNEDAQADLVGLPPTINARFWKLFKRLKAWPNVSGIKALRGELAGQYRARTGDYRAQFIVTEGHILVVKVGHRDGFYDD